MTTTIVIGLDGHGSGERALAHAQQMANLMGDCELVVAYIIEWSPYSFQTPEENAERHKRREEEISKALERIVDPAVKKLNDAGIKVSGIVRHGDVADALNTISKEKGAGLIIVGRSSEGGFARRIFGSATSNLVMTASVPVTVVN
jgi:nucleotide-binding universal stress UspA family protein